MADALRQRSLSAHGSEAVGPARPPAWRTSRWRPPGVVPGLVLALMLVPLVAGLAWTALPAFGWLPALGGQRLSLEPWRDLLALPGLWTSIRLTVTTGFAATLIALVVTLAFVGAWQGSRGFAILRRLLSPLLSIPHVTVAFGLAFLLTPSGWLVRLLSPWLTGWQRPPDLLIVHDPLGLVLVAGLVVKEVPFLLLVILAALPQADAERRRRVARTLGYGPLTAWVKAVLPSVYPQIRLPVYAVLAYALSTVDMAIVLAPTAPAPLAVRLLQLFNDPDLDQRFVACAGALLQLALVAAAIACWRFAELLAGRLLGVWTRAGGRRLADRWVGAAAAWTVALVALLAFAGLAGIALWSFVTFWRFPDAWPPTLTLSNWARFGGSALGPALHGALLGLVSAALAVVLALGTLESEVRRGGRLPLWIVYLPLLVPQIAFFFGVQVLLVVLDLDGAWPALVWAHLLVVLPYVLLSLADPFRAWDPRYGRTAACLGAGPGEVFRRVKLPMLLRPICTAAAVGFVVSLAQYIPTLLAGAGRFSTLTTEAVGLAAGGDRRIIGVYAVLQLLLPLAAFGLALGLPAAVQGRRRGLEVRA